MIKKVIILLNILLMFTMGIAAQTAISLNESSPGLVTDFATFTGIVSLVSLVVTQLAKLIPTIETKKWLKPIISVIVGILSCLFGWVLHIAPVLEGQVWYMVLLYGAFAGLSACGLYSILKPIIEAIFPSNKEEKA